MRGDDGGASLDILANGVRRGRDDNPPPAANDEIERRIATKQARKYAAQLSRFGGNVRGTWRVSRRNRQVRFHRYDIR